MSVGKVYLHDHSLCTRIGATREPIPAAQMIDIACALDSAGVPLIEVTRSSGPWGTRGRHGVSMPNDMEYLDAVIQRMKRAHVSASLFAAIDTLDYIRTAYDCGVQTLRIATHCAVPAIGQRHINLARRLGLDTVGVLRMSHMLDPTKLAEQAKKLESYGATCVYCADSAGEMLERDVTDRIAAMRDRLASSTEIGFRGRHNWTRGVANALAAVRAGARRVDGCIAGVATNAGNTPLDVFAALCESLKIWTGIDVGRLKKATEALTALFWSRRGPTHWSAEAPREPTKTPGSGALVFTGKGGPV